MERKALAFMPGMILDELADAVGGYDHISIEPSERATYGVDYFWIGRMWQDRGQVPVSYTHLDVYKRQVQISARNDGRGGQELLRRNQRHRPAGYCGGCLLYTSRCV